LGFVIQASLVRAGENNLVRVTGYGVTAHYDVTVRVDLSAIDFHVVNYGFECRELKTEEKLAL
jgi:hypothetical protein